ncbi:hypothetical protein [Mycetocola zhadangensis]|uniref:Uncharacterized protein n=1 Tax=Mycetocola zhadangensis TaxID=1164595 RepID=A0A3L7J0K6_9MICO|nr:hypothetical protein [Mycetocola zhadangensis]RLQ83998.1 hypothetical protein D9V28_07060 [Mycetocola zhadangensis]GGE96991.1 hypothetical protein GCM10011313_20050 [Mycetocola zhadangensis]
MSRFGPLEARGTTLVLGDAGGHHAELTASALVLREYREQPLSLEWFRVESVTLEVPETRFRLPGLVSTVALGVLGSLFGDWNIADDIQDGTLTVSVVGAEPMVMPITRHHVGGYWAKSVRAASALLARLVADPASRQLLHSPERVVKLLASGR